MTPDQIVRKYVAECERVYRLRTAGDHTWTGLLSDMLRDYDEARTAERSAAFRTKLEKIRDLRNAIRTETGTVVPLREAMTAVEAGVTTLAAYREWSERTGGAA